MPYGGTDKKQDKKIEECISKVMATGKNKVTAIKICKSSIMKEEKMQKETFTYMPEEKMKFAGTKITNIHIFKPGEYRGIEWTKEIIQKIVDNFKSLKEKAGFQPPVRVGHRGDDAVENAKSVIGYIDELYTDADGNLFSDVEVYEDKDIDNFKRLKRSVELGPYETNEGEEFDTTVWGLGLVDIPQVEKLAEVNVYSKPLMEDKMEKEKATDRVEEKEEEKIESKDSAEETSKGKNEKVELEKEEADESDESEDEESKEEMAKKSEMISMSKREVAELKAAKEKLDKIEVEKTETKLASRAEKIDAFHKEAKIVPAMLDKEKEFAQSLSDKQFDKYVEIKSSTPKLVELGKKSGSQTSNEPDKDTETQKLEKVTQKANELVVNSLIRQGYTKEKAEELLKK